MKASGINIKSDDGERECEQNGTKIVSMICYLNIFHHCLSQVDTRPYYDFNRPTAPESFASCAGSRLVSTLQQSTKVWFHFFLASASLNEMKKCPPMIHLMMFIYYPWAQRFVLWGGARIEWKPNRDKKEKNQFSFSISNENQFAQHFVINFSSISFHGRHQQGEIIKISQRKDHRKQSVICNLISIFTLDTNIQHQFTEFTRKPFRLRSTINY